MLHWKTLTSNADVDALIARSHEIPCLIFKHSTRCSISTIAKMRLDDEWDFAPEVIEPYYLDLISYRSVSLYVSETFEVYHESPQVLLISDGACIYDASHLDITIEELQETLSMA